MNPEDPLFPGHDVQPAIPEEVRNQLFEAIFVGDNVRAITLLSGWPLKGFINERDEETRTPLLAAANSGNIELVQWIIENYPEVASQRDPVYGMNATLIATRRGYLDLLKYLLAFAETSTHAAASSLGISCENGSGWGVLHYAANGAWLDIVKYLIEERHLPVDYLSSQSFDMYTPLLLASIKGEPAVVEYLLSKGANPEAEDKFGQTCIFHCARLGTLGALKVLVENGHANLNHKDHKGNTALNVADKCNSPECARFLYSAGASSTDEIKSHGLGSYMTWHRPLIRGDFISGRGEAGALVVGKRFYLWGGWGYPDGVRISSPDTKIGPEKIYNNTLHYMDLDVEEDTSIVPVNVPLRKKRGNSWNPKRTSSAVKVHADGAVNYIPSKIEEVGYVQAAEPFVKQDIYAYFEVTVLSAGANGYISVGYTDLQYSMFAHPGWEPSSYAYHGDLGWAFHDTGSGTNFAPKFTTGDTVGVGLNFVTGEVFFTHNGRFVGVPYHALNVDIPWYPTIGLQSPGEKVKVNFGESPFLYDFQAPTMTIVRPAVSGDLRALIWPQLHEISDGRILLVGILKGVVLPMVYTFDPNDNTLLPASYLNVPFPGRAERVCSTVKGDNLYFCIYNRGENEAELDLLRLSLSSKEWQRADMPDLNNFVKDDGVSFSESAIVEFWGGNLCIWEPFTNFAYTIEFEAATLETDWKKWTFTGKAPPSKQFSITQISPTMLLTFGGWDDQGQQSEVFILDMGNPEGDTLHWYKPHLGGDFPRPRNSHSTAYCKELKSMVVFGGWNGRNYIDDLEILQLDAVRPTDSLITFYDSTELSDVQVVSSDGKVIHSHSAVLVARSSYFRALLTGKKLEDVLRIEEGAPGNLLQAFINYLYTDLLDLSYLALNQYRFFLNEVAAKLGPEHVSRLTEELLATRVFVPSSMGSDLNYLWKTKDFYDITFEVGGHLIKCHKVIVCARSPMLRAMCLGGLKEASQLVIKLQDISYSAFSTAIEYIYNGILDFELISDSIMDVFTAASIYCISDLKNLLEGVISSNLTPDNVASLLVAANQLDAKKLLGACKLYIRQNLEIISNTPEYQELEQEVQSILTKDAQL